MTDETLTPEETAALQEMETDTGEGIEENATPEPDAEPAEQEKADAEPEGKEPEFKSSRTDEKPPEGFVPHQAMHAERVKRQEIERKLAELEATLQKQQASEQPPPQYVDPLEDPEGFRKWNEYQLGQVRQHTEAQQRAMQEHQQRQQIFADVQKSEAEFAAKAPDYQDAVSHLYQARVSELQNMGYGEKEIETQIAQDTMGLYQAAKMVGMNPAQFAYFRAQSFGYQPKAVSAPQPAPQAGQTEAQKMQALSRAQEATSGLGATGAPQDGGLTVAQLAKMSEEELAKIPDSEFKKVMGG